MDLSETLHEEVTKGFDAAIRAMVEETLKHLPQIGIQGAVTVVVTQDEKNEVSAICGILMCECEEDIKDYVYALRHRLQVLEDAQTAIKQKAVEVYREILAIKTANLDEARRRGH